MKWLVLLCLLPLASSILTDITFLNNTVSPGAVCNDGTPGSYYYRKGNSTDNWVIYLFGGALCSDRATCLARNASDPNLVTSRLNPAQFDFPMPDPFLNFTVVAIPYCSSDVWSGMRTTATDYGFIFAGHRILHGVLDDLKARRGLNDAKKVAFWGDSAGAFGVFLNVDFVDSELPAAVDVSGIVNSGWFLSETGAQLPFNAFSVYDSFWDQSCNASAVQPSWWCLIPDVTYQYISSRVFTIQSTLDIFELFVSLQIPQSPTSYDRIVAVGNRYLDRLSILQNRPQDGWYIVSCFTHVSNVTVPLINNTRIADAVLDFVVNNNKPRFLDGCYTNSSAAIQIQFPTATCRDVVQQCLKGAKFTANPTYPLTSAPMATTTMTTATSAMSSTKFERVTVSGSASGDKSSTTILAASASLALLFLLA